MRAAPILGPASASHDDQPTPNAPPTNPQTATKAIAANREPPPVPHHRRYLWIFLDGLRPDREQASPPPVPPLTTDETHRMLGAPPSADHRA